MDDFEKVQNELKNPMPDNGIYGKQQTPSSPKDSSDLLEEALWQFSNISLPPKSNTDVYRSMIHQDTKLRIHH